MGEGKGEYTSLISSFHKSILTSLPRADSTIQQGNIAQINVLVVGRNKESITAPWPS